MTKQERIALENANEELPQWLKQRGKDIDAPDYSVEGYCWKDCTLDAWLLPGEVRYRRVFRGDVNRIWFGKERIATMSEYNRNYTLRALLIPEPQRSKQNDLSIEDIYVVINLYGLDGVLSYVQRPHGKQVEWARIATEQDHALRRDYDEVYYVLVRFPGDAPDRGGGGFCCPKEYRTWEEAVQYRDNFCKDAIERVIMIAQPSLCVCS